MFRQGREILLELLLGEVAPRPVGVPPLADEGALEDEADRSFGVSRGEQQGKRPAFGLAHDRGPLAADGVHDRSDVVHPLLEGHRLRDAVGHAHSPLIEHNEARELGQPLAVAPVGGQLPVDLEVGVGTLDVDEVDRPLADHAVGDVDVAAAREPNVRHPERLARRAERVNPDFVNGRRP